MSFQSCLGVPVSGVHARHLSLQETLREHSGPTRREQEPGDGNELLELTQQGEPRAWP